MVAFGHTAVGVGVGLVSYQLIGHSTSPILGLAYTGGAGIISHYLADFIPHGHFLKLKNYRYEITILFFLDFLLSVIIFLLAAYHSYGLNLKILYILFGLGGAQLPDILFNLIKLGLLPNLGIFQAEDKLHTSTHWHGRGKGGLPIRIFDIWQVGVVALVLYITASGKL